MKFKKGTEITTSDFWYDLFDGGYIKPCEILKSKEEAEAVETARLLLRKFRDELRAQDLINDL